LKFTIVGHITIDNIQLGAINLITLGGAASYSSLIVKGLGGEVNLVTKFGKDLPEEYLLSFIRNKIRISKHSISNSYPTTKFKIELKNSSREIYLKSRCEDINSFGDNTGDAAIISPVAGEVGNKLLKNIRKNHDIIFLDPQDFIRKFNENGNCFMRKMDHEILNYLDIIKMDEVESFWVTGSREPIKALRFIMNSDLKVAIFTRGSKGILLYCHKGLFKIPIRKKMRVVDTTGVGDIFSGAFTVTYLQQKDPIWAGCIGVAASSIGISKIGLSKIPNKKLITNIAEKISEKVEQIESI